MSLEDKRILRVTEIGDYKRCKLLWDFKFNQNLTPISEAPRFFVGRLVHRCLELWAENPEWKIGKCFSLAMKEEQDKMIQRYTETIGVKPNNAEIHLWLEKGHLPMAMVQNYANYWKTPLPEGYKLISAEQTCLVQIPSVSGVVLEGTLDGLAIDETTGYLYIVEHKTYEQRPKLETLENVEQFVGYAWIVRQLFPDRVIGGILYDGLWKRDVTEKRPIEECFMRHHLVKTDYELDKWEENLVKVAKEIEEGPEIYPNRPWQGCWDDKPFHELCSAMMKGYDVDEIRSDGFELRKDAWRFNAEEGE